ncbi:MAG: J domain-containing protein [Myxococcales bacterium]|nr:J domain-containing protein [Myxococcales bacterium]
MSLTKRFWDLARSNLSDFRTAFDRSDPLDELTEEERRALEEELEAERKKTVGARAGRTARRVKDAAEEAWEKAYEKAQRGGGGSGGLSDEAQRRRWYRTLELEPGADIDAIRKSYRRLLRTYHPDKFAQDPEKSRAATELTRNLTEAYDGLARHLGAK